MEGSETKTKCIILLSSKSSGSSALQNILCMLDSVSHVEATKHRQNETLYWVKAASILNRAQCDMLDSEVPIQSKKAKLELVEFLECNLGRKQAFLNDYQLIYSGWAQLCSYYSPVFFEKSPHHLHQWSALELINQCVKECPSIEFLFVGLVRNPMDIIYSRWSGSKTIPEKYQYEWICAYENFLRFRDKSNTNFVTIKYEDMIQNVGVLQPIFDFIGVDETEVMSNYLHKKALNKWKKDKTYGFVLSKRALELGEKLGYRSEEMINDSKLWWPLNRNFIRARHNVFKPLRLLRRTIRSGLKAST